MNEEEKIKQALEEKFAYLKDAVLIKRKGRISVELPLKAFDEVFDYALHSLRFQALAAITGMDTGDAFAVIYHLSREGTIVLNLRVGLDREHPAVKTVTSYFPGADVYERELVDLLGIDVKGLAAGDRYPLPDNWPKGQFPLRKSWHAAIPKSEVKNA